MALSDSLRQLSGAAYFQSFMKKVKLQSGHHHIVLTCTTEIVEQQLKIGGSQKSLNLQGITSSRIAQDKTYYVDYRGGFILDSGEFKSA
jgi:hypothetical protein